MNPIYHRAAFLKSAPSLETTPTDQGLEVAFAGRSNAGKSSAINSLTRQNQLAKISKTPGRTQMLNFFEFGTDLRFVDLPGYGYAKVPEDVKLQWYRLMESYLNKRQSLCAIVLVMDVRHPMTDFDWQMVEWCEHAQLPMHILLTKSDKLTYGAGKNTLLKVQKELSKFTIPLSLQLFSSLKKTGIDEVHAALDSLFSMGGQQAEDEVGEDTAS